MYCKNAELAYWLGADFRGKGIMPQVLEMFVHDLFMEHGMHRVWARPFEQNKSSRKVLQKAGFAFEGLLKIIIRKAD